MSEEQIGLVFLCMTRPRMGAIVESALCDPYVLWIGNAEADGRVD
jgi:hypothetical protein